ncbi:MAG: hypothetical protein JO328_19820 [Hyphomicrobiales bacterium]|nr:hypothetical protein [Hyphomicrobiales bacterium]MBV9429637.1 hypothetical protein [Bradyrhizobiaceae bacterium]
MSTREVQYSGPTPTSSLALAMAIVLHGATVLVATQVGAIIFRLQLPFFPSIAICGAGILLGLLLDLLEIVAPPATAPPGAGPPPTPSSMVYAFLMVVVVCVIIFLAFCYARRDPNGYVAVAFAFAAALAWALSVAGSLLWTSFFLISHFRWNSWMNFFAAGFAALAAGYTPPG